MNIKDAKSIPIDEFLENLGHNFAREVRGRKWYRRPWGDERTPSFVLTPDKHAWYDHGEGVGGNILDLAIRYADLRDVPEALRYIERVMGTGYVIQPPKVEFKKMEPETPFYTVTGHDYFKPFKNRQELTPNGRYLSARGIDLVKAALYLSDIEFVSKDDPKNIIHGFGMRNQSDGFEARANLFGTGYRKTTAGPKDVTLLPARDTAHGADDWYTKPWRAFYSMMDFLTFITLDQNEPGTYNFLVIHGDALIHKAAEYINGLPAPGYMVHYPHIDKNGNGQRAMFDLMGATPGWRGGEVSHEYEGFKDLNEWHMYQLKLDYRPASVQLRPSKANNPRLKP